MHTRQVTDPTIEFVPTGPWRHCQYAMFHSHGVGFMFDTLRYDNAFLVREEDVATFLDASGDGLGHILRDFRTLICRVSQHGKSKPGWTHDRLLHHQFLEEISDPERLFKLCPQFCGFAAKPSLKWLATRVVTGDLSFLLKAMLNNRAAPADESSSHAIENAFHHPAREITVRLKNWLPTPADWVGV